MAAQNGVFHFIGSKGTYTVSAYWDDTAGNPVRFNTAGKAGATSPTDWSAPEGVALIDVCMAAASGQTHTQLATNGQPTGDMFLNSIHLASIAFRPHLKIIYKPGEKVSAFQIA